MMLNRQQRRAIARNRPQPTDRNANQPSRVGFCTLRAAIGRDVQKLRVSAGLQAWAGDNVIDAINTSGRLLWITLNAAIKGGVDEDAPDIRILRGMGSALGDLRERGDPLDAHRQAIQAGLLAVDRVLPICTEIDLFFASKELDEMISSCKGIVSTGCV